MKRRTKLLLLAIVMILSLTGCTKYNGTIPKESANPNEESSVKSPEEKKYTDIEGVLTFRGNNLRNSPSYGFADVTEKKLEKIWTQKAPAKGEWGGGSGWTGQPALVKWKKEVREIMNIKEKFKQDDNFVEVIIGSLNGSVYFYDLKTGEQTREPIKTDNPIKGSVSIDSRGYPMLYVGQGVPANRATMGFHIYSLIDQTELYFQNGYDERAKRVWGAFDSSALFDRETDELIVGGENGLLYKLKLNTEFSVADKTIKISPVTEIYSFDSPRELGIESSLAAYEDLIFFSDNSGLVKGIDINLKSKWEIDNLDDSDNTVTLNIEDRNPYVFTASQVHFQGEKGISRILKIDGKTGEMVWKKEYPCFSRIGESKSSGGSMSTNLQGKNQLKDIVYFNLCRYKTFTGGLLLALDKKTGEEVWRKELPTYSWPSTIDIYDKDGKGYIIQVLRNGTVYLMDGLTGELLDDSLKIGTYVEASPSAFNDIIVQATRDGDIVAMRIK